MMLSHDVSKVNSFIISKGLMNSFNEMFPLAHLPECTGRRLPSLFRVRVIEHLN